MRPVFSRNMSMLFNVISWAVTISFSPGPIPILQMRAAFLIVEKNWALEPGVNTGSNPNADTFWIDELQWAAPSP